MSSEEGPVVKVKKKRGEETLKKLKTNDMLDGRRVIEQKGDTLYIPVKEGGDENYRLKKRRIKPTPFERISNKIDLPKKMEEHLPDRWEKVGDVVLIKLPDSLYSKKELIGEVYAEVLNAKTVLIQKDIQGTKREPNVEVIYGEETETVHLENGIKFKLDLSKLMFSSGNIDERVRMAEVADEDEVIVDMFAGIGYFTLPLAVHSKPDKIYSLEINPVAYRYLKENVRSNRVEDIVEICLGDNRNFPKTYIADRIVMGYLHDTHRFLPKALELLKEKGVIHYHTRVADTEFPGKVEREISNNVDGGYEIMKIHKIKSYAPHVYHVVADIKVG